MKVVILAGGMGTRLSEETEIRPKPMVEIGKRPILWHIMKTYSHFGLNDFVVCLGYKGYMVKEYFANYFLHQSDVTFDLKNNGMEIHHQKTVEPWKVTLVDTGPDTMTGGRIKKIKEYVQNEDFCLTYGDGVGDVDIKKLIEFHRTHGKLATITATRPPGRFGALKISDSNKVERFEEKPDDGGWINGGFFVCKPGVFELIEGDDTIWERQPLETMAAKSQLHAFKHPGFWHPMDTVRDRNVLEGLWNSGKAPWQVWK